MSASDTIPTDRVPDWLEGCERFRVDSPAGRLGLVEGVRRDPVSGKPEALVVRAGTFGRRRLVVPVDEIAGIVPGAHVVVLRERWPAADSGHP